MAERKRGMGRGLAAILPESGAGGPELRELSVSQIEPNPDQPRKHFDKGPLDALAGSIASAGVLQPLIVRPVDDGRFEIVAGERRWRAAQQAGLDRVPAVVRTSPADERLQAALIENMVREDLNPVDEARACAALVDDLGISKEELARRVGRSRAAISNLVRLLDLPDDVQSLLERGKLSEGHGRAILQVDDQEKRSKLAKQAAAEGWSVRQIENKTQGARRQGARSALRRAGGSAPRSAPRCPTPRTPWVRRSAPTSASARPAMACAQKSQPTTWMSSTPSPSASRATRDG